MKIRFFHFLLFLSLSVFSQNKIKGIVLSNENKPLEGASVYLNNTMIGAVTNNKGEFTLVTKDGQFEIIVSFLGFKKIIHSLHTSTYKKPFVFKLTEEKNILNEVVLKKIIYDKNWYINLGVFKKEFIGLTELAKDCKILNPKVLHFDFDYKNQTLTAYAKKPLQIKNKSLGYLITYELENFTRTKTHITYLGYTRYKNTKGSKRKQKKWNTNRRKAYNGSQIHFYKSVINNSFTEEGFIVNQFKRVPNAERPTEAAINKARRVIRLHKKPIRFNAKITQPKNALDSALLVLQKVKLPKFRDYLYKSKLLQKDIINQKNNQISLSFTNNLSVIYTKEKEELGFVNRNIFSKKRAPLNVQTSAIIPNIKNSALDKNGILINPLDVFYEGYWSYEKFANSLPLDYQPED